MSPNKPRRGGAICLNMIVRDETPVLDRLFRSVRPLIDHYVIVDTGSTDGTPAYITQWMSAAGIDGELHQRPWRNFGHNRDEALALALARGQADWVLFIDADEELVCRDPALAATLQPGTSYLLEKKHGSLRYRLPALVDVRRNTWRWRGAAHEALEHVSGPDRRQALPWAWIVYHEGEGIRSRGRTPAQKFLSDAQLLLEELQQDPGNPRSRFYLAQSYRDAGEAALALEHYRLRAGMSGGWAEERFWAQLEVGRMSEALGLPFAEVAQEYLRAHQLRPRRGEALHELARFARLSERWDTAYLVAQEGARLKQPADQLFVMPEVYAWRLLDELAVAAYWMGHYAESCQAGEEVLRRHARGQARVPEAELARVRENVARAQAKRPAAEFRPAGKRKSGRS